MVLSSSHSMHLLSWNRGASPMRTCGMPSLHSLSTVWMEMPNEGELSQGVGGRRRWARQSDGNKFPT